MFENFIDFVRHYYANPHGFIPLHAPVFRGNERKYVLDAIDSTFVSSVGAYVDEFEKQICEITNAKHAVATVNGTAALHAALVALGVTTDHEVITQPLSFVASANAISYTGAKPIFIDVDRNTLGLSATKLREFLQRDVAIQAGVTINKITGRRISACLPMHTFGFPVQIDEIVTLCEEYNIPVVEDASEALGSYYRDKHTGLFGRLGIFSFNGNKTVTCGGGGVIVTNDAALASRLKHITTTAKVSHPWEYYHDEIGFNYRLPNLNAAFACAQLEQLDTFILEKRALAENYRNFFAGSEIVFFSEPRNARANYWLNTIILKDREQRQNFLTYTNGQKVMTRPAWHLLHTLPMFKNSHCSDLEVSTWLAERIVNIPSGIKT